jgi:hypothetical protein
MKRAKQDRKSPRSRSRRGRPRGSPIGVTISKFSPAWFARRQDVGIAAGPVTRRRHRPSSLQPCDGDHKVEGQRRSRRSVPEGDPADARMAFDMIRYQTPGAAMANSRGRRGTLFSSTFYAYIDGCRREPAMAINGRRNKPIGPGGSTRRLHQSRTLPDMGAKQDRRGRKGRAFARHGTAVIGPIS